MTFLSNPNAIMALYQKLGPFSSAGSLQAASLALTAALRTSMTETTLYNIPADQCLPADQPADTIPVLVHPHNIASALVGVCTAAASFGGQLPIDASLQIYSPAASGWVTLASIAASLPTVQVQVEVPPPAPVIPAAPPPAPGVIAPAPAAAIAPAPAPAAAAAPQPTVDIAALVDAAMAAPVGGEPLIDPSQLAAPQAVAANPVQPQAITTAEEFAAYRAQQGYAPVTIDNVTQQVVDAAPAPTLSTLAQVAAPAPVNTPADIKGPPLDQRTLTPNANGQLPGAPLAGDPERALQHAASGGLTTAQGVAGPAVVSHQQAMTEAAAVPVAALGLPDPSVLAPRTNPKTGREQASPFGRKVEPRKSIAANPWWWEFFNYSAPRLFNANPSAALDPESTGSGPVQAYTALVELMISALDGADPDVTAAQLRSWLREVQTGYNGLDDAAAINQLADHMFRGAK